MHRLHPLRKQPAYPRPVSIGRLLMSLFGVSQAPEIYTAAVGLYTLWLIIRFGATIVSYVMQGTEILVEQMKLWSLQGVKCAVAGVLLFVVIPLLLGHLVDLLLISPLRVPYDRTPVFYPSTVSGVVVCVCVWGGGGAVIVLVVCLTSQG